MENPIVSQPDRNMIYAITRTSAALVAIFSPKDQISRLCVTARKLLASLAEVLESGAAADDYLVRSGLTNGVLG